MPRCAKDGFHNDMVNNAAIYGRGQDPPAIYSSTIINKLFYNTYMCSALSNVWVLIQTLDMLG